MLVKMGENLPHFWGENEKHWRNHHPGIVSAYFFQGETLQTVRFFVSDFGIPPAFSTLHHIPMASFRPKKSSGHEKQTNLQPAKTMTQLKKP